jgi:general secretion pathway protein E
MLQSSDSPEDAPQILERLVHQAEQAGASDIHFQMTGRSAIVTFRLDGVMTSKTELPHEIAERVFGRIKYLSRLKTYQESLPQDGRIDKETLNARSDIRVATYPTVTGEKIVLRLFDTRGVKALAELGFPEDLRSQLESFLKLNVGLLLLTGPAGSGKTTTIYACLQHLAAPGGRHIITVEDPVEQIVPGVMQTEINEPRGLDFAKAARHLLRQDPQVLVIGEVRDEATANVAVRAALTGHLVISTLHAGSCKGVFERLAAMYPDPAAVASSVELVLNQRLLRRLCPGCGGTGCAVCLHTGYRGRVPLVELLRVTDPLRRLIAEKRFEELGVKPTLAQRGEELLASKTTNREEIARVLAGSR